MCYGSARHQYNINYLKTYNTTRKKKEDTNHIHFLTHIATIVLCIVQYVHSSVQVAVLVVKLPDLCLPGRHTVVLP